MFLITGPKSGPGLAALIDPLLLSCRRASAGAELIRLEMIWSQVDPREMKVSAVSTLMELSSRGKLAGRFLLKSIFRSRRVIIGMN